MSLVYTLHASIRCDAVVASLARPIKSTPQRIHTTTIENSPTCIQTTPEYTAQKIR